MKKKAPELLNKLSWGIAVGVGLLFCCFGERTKTKLLVIVY